MKPNLKKVSFSLIATILFNVVIAMFITSFTGLSYNYSLAAVFMVSFFVSMPKSATYETLIKPISEHLAEMKTLLEGQMSVTAKAEVDAQIKSYESKIEDLKTKGVNKEELKALSDVLEEVKSLANELKAWRVTKDEADGKNQAWINKQMQRNGKVSLEGGAEVKTFNQVLGETIERNAAEIRGFRRGELYFDMMPDAVEGKDYKLDDEKKKEVKAVGDMSIATNFPAASVLYQEQRPLILNPYNRVFLGDILPQASSSATQIAYPVENGQDGGAALWEDYTADKAQIDFNITSSTAFFKWIAGYVIVDRESLDDITWLQGYLQQKMLISLKSAENNFIINGSASGAKEVKGFQDLATTYNGTNWTTGDVGIQRMIDSAFGQIPDDTYDQYSGSNFILTRRDTVKVGLHQASGSGEFDLPEGSVGFSNGNLNVASLPVVPISSQVHPANTFYAFDKSATQFVTRMRPELRLFEDSALAKKNKVMFRIEERVTLLVFNNKAIVKGVLFPS